MIEPLPRTDRAPRGFFARPAYEAGAS